MTTFAIEKNVAVPKINNSIYPFEDMVVGDSFWVPKAHAKSARQYCYKARDGKKFISRASKDGLRIWRII